jgi:hypothetical protein
MSLKSHVIIDINSKDRDSGTSIEQPKFTLSHQITFSQSPSKSYYMRLENTLLPKSFYDIDSNNNTFLVIEDDGTPSTLTVNISPGNYTITELLTELETELDTNTADANAYTLSYDDITNKVTFNCAFGTSTSVTIDSIANGSTLNALLGFGKNTPTLSDSQISLTNGVDNTATYVVDLDTKSYVIIEATNLTSKNYYDKNIQKHVGQIIPMNVDRNEKQHFENSDGHLSLLNGKQSFNRVEFILKDEDGNILDLNGIDWSTTLCIYEMTEIWKFN